MKTVQLTKFSHGSGCGCKISPEVLNEILKSNRGNKKFSRLLVGYDSRDDAAVYGLGDGTAIVSTTDFFMPVVDDPYDFGYIAAVNAISDIYAMGGTPLVAISVLGWPVEKLAPSVARKVIAGGRGGCRAAGIPIAGGHSIDSPEPFFGLAVTGKIAVSHIKRNNTAVAGCELYLTKPLGMGILTTAQKKGALKRLHTGIAEKIMKQLNSVGETFARMKCVKAMTDVTGFGLGGHLLEMCEGSKLSAVINFDDVPVVPAVVDYIEKDCIPGGTQRNWKSYGRKINGITGYRKKILCDPQTSGGLLVAVEPSGRKHVLNTCKKTGTVLFRIGYLLKNNRNWIIDVR